MAERRVATPTDYNAQRTEQLCQVCGTELLYSVSMSTGSRWLHWPTCTVRCPSERKTNG